jgi:hypothetical protein
MEAILIPGEQYHHLKEFVCAEFDRQLDQAQTEGDVLNIMQLGELVGFGWYTHDFLKRWEFMKIETISMIRDDAEQMKFNLGL